MKLVVQSLGNDISGSINLPVSKSFLNRYLVLRALSGKKPEGITSQFPKDVRLLSGMLNSNSSELNAGDAGTAMRFATAFFASQDGNRKISGTSRMLERPIGELVSALNQLGGSITYLDGEGYPPLQIQGGRLKGGKVQVRSDISSQFISALLMIAPICENQVEIELIGNRVSAPYLNLTIEMTEKFGVEIQEISTGYIIAPQTFKIADLRIENDWSSSAFIYGIAAVTDNFNIELPGLQPSDIQGDKEVMNFFAHLGVQSAFNDSGLVLTKASDFICPTILELDFTHHPDLVQVFVMTCLALNVELRLEGLFNLHLKETDRLEAIRYNVHEAGGKFEIDEHRAKLFPTKNFNQKPNFNVFGDHRMAMALIPLVKRIERLEINDAEVVEKSFPNFWQELRNLGLEIIEIS